MGGGNGKAGYVKLMAGETTLFNIADPASGTTMTLNYGESSTANITVAGMNKSKRFSANTKDVYNTKNYWYHITIVGDPTNGVKMTMKSCADEPVTVVEDVVLSATNVTPSSLIVKLGSITSHGIDDLSLTYYVEGEVVQNPIPAYTAVDGINRTITATCETEGATIQHSADGITFEDGASLVVSESCTVYFKAVKGTSESDVISFDVVAGEEIVLNTPVINRTSDTSVTISADQSKLLLSPDATIYYTYGDEKGSFTGSKTLTVAADAVITAYAEFEGYTTSETAERAVALFPSYYNQIENTASKTSGWSANAFSDETITASERTYAALLLDDAQWGKNIYLQTDGAWGLRTSGNWYINSDTKESWLLMQNMKKGDIIVVDVTYPASSTVNATFSKYTYGSRQAYEVDEDGNVELAFKKINASTMDYFYGVYAYQSSVSVPCTNGFATYANHDVALDFTGVSGLTAYTATVEGDVVTFTPATKVPAGTGLLLKGATADVPMIASADAISENIFYAPTTAVASLNYDQDDYYNYILTSVGGNVGFYRANNNSVAVGKAYLRIAKSTGARQFTFIGLDNDSETTGIADVKGMNSDNKNFYNLNGQRIVAPQKGLYIVNGKKVIIK